MYVDSHVHLQPHGQKPPITRERIELYVESARAHGVERIAFTEHLFRFQEAFESLHGWWEADTENPALHAVTEAYLEDSVSTTVAEYVRVVEEAKSDGLPVLLGLEMDWFPDRGEELRRFLEPYDWDIVLGAVHWIGAWDFDSSSKLDLAEWERRDVDTVFNDYAALVSDLAGSGLCDVLAHPDLPKLFGHRPSSFTPLHTAIVAAATDGGCAVEINSNGYNKPVAEAYPAVPLLKRAHEAGLSITLASDAHEPERVGERFDDLAALATLAGYDEFVAFEDRKPATHPMPSPSAKRH